MLSWLSILFTAFLSVALIAFGWMPCPTCCGGGGISCVTCANIPTTLHGVLSISGGSCGCASGPDLNGLAITFTYNAILHEWLSPGMSACGLVCQFIVFCADATHMGFSVNFPSAGNACQLMLSGSVVNSTSLTCPPTFQAVFTGTVSATTGTCPCSGRTWTLTVTS